MSSSAAPSFNLFSVISVADEQSNYFYLDDHRIVEDYLVVHVDRRSDRAFLINLDTTARAPIKVSYEELVLALEHGEIVNCTLQLDKRVTQDMRSLSKDYLSKMKERWEAIECLTIDLESTLMSEYGKKIFKEAAKKAGRHKQYIYDSFYSWLRNGCRRQALGLPQGKDANRIPKERELRVKQGAPNNGIARGKILDDYDYDKFKIAKRRYTKTKGLSISKVLRQIWREYYWEQKVKLSAAEAKKLGIKHRVVLKPPTDRPTYNQFYYWLMKEFGGNLPKRDRRKSNATEYAANQAGRTGDSSVNCIAPGEQYQIDETPFDEEVVSVFDLTRQTKLGKATIYFVSDAFSHAIVGIYITTSPPSYITAREALFCAARDKKRLIEETGAPISPERWPMQGVPTEVLTDKGIFNSLKAEGSITDLPFKVSFTRSGRGDDKGLIESMFSAFLNWFKGISKATQTKSHRDIALQIARKHACLTIPELYQIAYVYADQFNNSKVIKDYPATRTMVQDDVPHIPIRLWEWGLKNRPGYLLEMPDEELYMRLLERAEVSIHRNHILLLGTGLRYNRPWILDQGYQDRLTSRNKAIHMPCRIHNALVDFIYICTPDGLKQATLDTKDQRYSGLGFNEVVECKNKENTKTELLNEVALNDLVNADAFLEKTIKEANKRLVRRSLSSIGTIKENRAVESVLEQINQKYRFLNSIATTSEDDFLSENHAYAQNDGSVHAEIDADRNIDPDLQDFYAGEI